MKNIILAIIVAAFLSGCVPTGLTESDYPVKVTRIGVYKTMVVTSGIREETVIIAIEQKDGLNLLLQDTTPSNELKIFIKNLKVGNYIHFKACGYPGDNGKKSYGIVELVDLSTGAIFRK